MQCFSAHPGSWFAHSTDGELNEMDLVTAKYQGQRVANLAKRFAV